MTAILRVVLDQVVTPTDPDLATASAELGRALIQTAPSGCAVEAIVPSAPDVAATLERDVPGLVDATKTLARRELAAAWQLGVAPGIASGMIHSPTLLAPLVRHDRVHDSDQTVVTLWDLAAWERPQELGRTAVAWHKAMLKRAVRFADAVVVPSHAAAERLAELASFGDRVRVIAGAAPTAFRVPVDEIGRRRSLGLPEGFLLVAGSSAASSRLDEAFTAIAHAGSDLPVVVIGAPEGDEPAIADAASAAGLAERRVHVRGTLDAGDRAAVFAAAVAFLAPARDSAFPWRLVEALAIGVPVVASDSPAHREVVVDGGLLAADADAWDGALASVLGSTAAVERLAVLSADRGRAFSWLGAAERVWQLHADL